MTKYFSGSTVEPLVEAEESWREKGKANPKYSLDTYLCGMKGFNRSGDVVQHGSSGTLER